MAKAPRSRRIQIEMWGDRTRSRDFLIAVAGQLFQLSRGRSQMIGIAKLCLILSRCEAPDAESGLDGPKIAKIKRLQLVARNTHFCSGPMGTGAKSDQGLFDFLAIAVILVAHHDEPSVRVQIAAQFP